MMKERKGSSWFTSRKVVLGIYNMEKWLQKRLEFPFLNSITGNNKKSCPVTLSSMNIMRLEGGGKGLMPYNDE